MPDRKIRDAIFLSGIFLFGASYSDFQMYEDYQPQSAQRELMASAVFSVTSVAIHPYENRCSDRNDDQSLRL
jgi:hypothetical protein